MFCFQTLFSPVIVYTITDLVYEKHPSSCKIKESLAMNLSAALGLIVIVLQFKIDTLNDLIRLINTGEERH